MAERKTIDRWDIETNYGNGWECECSEYTKAEAEEQYQCYVDNACGRYAVRLTKHRVRVCPNCGKPIEGEPAISRKDNRTKICSNCGQAEALGALIGRKLNIRRQ